MLFIMIHKLKQQANKLPLAFMLNKFGLFNAQHRHGTMAQNVCVCVSEKGLE